MASLSRHRALLVALVAVATAACAGPTPGHSLIGDPTPIGAPAQASSPRTAPARPAVARTTAAPRTTVAPPTAAPTTAPAAPGRQSRPYPVGFTNLDLTDTTRPTGSRPGRHLPTIVFYPAIGPGGGAETGGAHGLRGPWPLVVFAHGYDVTPLTYHDLLHHMAESGYVVAAPSFPLETHGGPLDENDLSNEPADIKFVITQVLAAAAGGGDGVLKGMVDPAHVALIGHSDGAEAVLGAAYLPGVADPRVGPVVAMAAQGILDDDRIPSVPRHPLLVVQGTADTINPPVESDRLYASAPSPKAYLQLLGASHLPPVADSNRWRPIVEATVVDWLDAWLGGPDTPGAAGRLGHDANVAGVAQIQLG